MVGVRDEAAVRYRAVADFADLIKQARKAKAAVAALKKEEEAYNAAAKDADKSTEKQAEAFRDKQKATIAAAKATRDNSRAVKEKSDSLRETARETKNVEKAERSQTSVERELQNAIKRTARQHKSRIIDVDRTSTAYRKLTGYFSRFTLNLDRSNVRLQKLDGWLTRLRHFRPRLIPPFIALIPIIGSLLALINPLVAGLGAIGAAGFGLASSLGLAAGSAVALVPALSTLVGVVSTLLLAFNGVGDALKSGFDGDIEKFEKAMEKLTPSAREFVKETLKIGPAWREVREAVQESFFAQLSGDMEKLTRAAPALRQALSGIATALGQVVSKGIGVVSSGPWSKDFVTLGESSARVVSLMGDGLIFLATALKDVAVAAGPFLERLTKGFREGAANFATLVAEGRKSGSLAAYLDRAGDSLAQWWRIAKNITATIVNYASAAREFNRWTTDGFEKLSASWRKASQEAKREGSPYKRYLEEIKPLLVQTRGLFGDFFRWFKDQAMDSGNIEAMTRIVELIRTELGPALGDIIETLADSGIGESLIKALSSILQAIDDFLQHGGAAAFQTFWEITAGIFEFFASVVKSLPMGVVKTLATTLAVISALKFFGIYDLAKGLGLLLAKSGLLRAFSTAIAGMSTQFMILQRATAVAGTGGIFATITNGAKAAGGALGRLGGAFLGFLGGPVGLAITALGIVFGIFTSIAQAEQEAAAKAQEYESDVDNLTDSLDGLGEATKRTADLIKENLSEAFNKIDTDNSAFIVWGEKLDKKVPDYLKEIGISSDDMAQALQRGGVQAENMRKKLAAIVEEGRLTSKVSVTKIGDDGKLESSWEQQTSGYTDRARAAQKLLAIYDEESQKLSDAKSKYQELANAQQEYRATLTDAERATEDFNGALATLQDAASTAEERVNALKNAVDILLGRTLSAKEAEALYVEEMQNLADTLENLNPALVDASGNFDLAAEGGLDLHNALTDVRDGMYEAMDAAYQNAVANGDVAGAQEAAKKAGEEWVTGLRDQLTQMGLNETQIDSLVTQYGLLPDTVSTVLALDGATTTETQLLAIKGLLESTPENTPVEVTTGALTANAIKTLEKAGFTVKEIPGSKNVTVSGTLTNQFWSTINEATRTRTAMIRLVATNGGASMNWGGREVTAQANGGLWKKGVQAFADGGMVRKYANGGTDTGIYKGRKGGIIKFAEPETKWEAYISGKPGKENRNRQVAAEAVQRLGGFATFSQGLNGIAGGLEQLRRSGQGFAFANGGTMDYGRVGITGHQTPSMSSGDSAPRAGVVIENLNVNNPAPEPTSETLPRTIRKVAYLGV